MPDPRDELAHEPGSDHPLWGESWYLDFVNADGSLGGYVRLGRYPNKGVAWCWVYVVGDGRPLLAVRDHEAPLPRGSSMEVRSSGLWLALHCEEPLEHWSVGVEAFAVGLDDPADAYGDERGDLVAVGLDLEWEGTSPVYDYPGVTRYEQPCSVHGELLIGDEKIAIEGWGERDHSWGVRDWWAFPWMWTSGRLDDGTAYHGVRVGPGERAFQTGFVADPSGALSPVLAVTLATQLGAHDLPARASIGVGDLTLTAEPRHHAPVHLVADDGRRSRFPRSLCRVTTDDGRAGWGWTEWLQPPTPV